ncbi:hypothetical protein QT970_01510, partial [Microcoleus sp. herbarium8]
PPFLRGAGGDLSKQLREALAAPGKERIRDLVKNPLRCSLLCGTWQSLDGDLPDTKAKLYQRFVTTLYQWKKPQLNWIQQQDLNAALGKLALAGMLNETERFQLRESVGYRVMGASQFELACRLGWLNLVARDAETLEGIYAAISALAFFVGIPTTSFGGVYPEPKGERTSSGNPLSVGRDRLVNVRS